jgi:starch phosphorylase
MWQGIWPGRAPEMVPIAHITNGVHAPSWLGHPVRSLLDAELGPDWERWLAGGERLAGVDAVDDGDLWAAHRAQKRRLLDFIAFRSGETLDENALLLGFARRFAPYKRGDLLLSEPLRLAKLLGNPEQPGYLVYGGKSHPRDEPGKAIIRRVIEASRLPGLEGRVLFLEDYDIGVGRALVQGVDVWVNNPRRPLEASGTSGQKVAMNGGLNVSTLDGWWLEAYEQQPLAGWAVGEAEPATDDGVGDKADGEAMYRVMEDEVFPTYFRRDESGLPRDWIKRMKKAIATCLPAYNTDRMVADYVEYAYVRPSNPDATVV